MRPILTAQRLKEALEAYKVFFETIAAVLLSLMAIFVSVAQSCTAARQTELLERQTAVAVAQLVPQVNIRLERKHDAVTDSFPDEAIIVENVGGLGREWNAFTIDILRVGCMRYQFLYSLEIRLNDFFSSSTATSAATGEIARFLGTGNNRHIEELRAAMADTQICSQPYPAVDHYVVVNYTDMLGSRHWDMYFVTLSQGGMKLSDKKANEMWKTWSDFPLVIRNLSDLTPSFLLSQLRQTGVAD